MNISQTTNHHASKVLDAMREAMKDVPKEHRYCVMAQIYQTIGKSYHRAKSNEK